MKSKHHPVRSARGGPGRVVLRPLPSRNTMSKGAYLCFCVVTAALAMALYRCRFYRAVPELGEQGSLDLLYLLTAVLTPGGIALSWDRWRNSVSALSAAALPFQLYAYLTYVRYLALNPVMALCSVITLPFSLLFPGVLDEKDIFRWRAGCGPREALLRFYLAANLFLLVILFLNAWLMGPF